MSTPITIDTLIDELPLPDALRASLVTRHTFRVGHLLTRDPIVLRRRGISAAELVDLYLLLGRAGLSRESAAGYSRGVLRRAMRIAREMMQSATVEKLWHD